MASRKFQTSLAGVAVTDMSRSEGFTVYQMDSYGDIFYQTVNMHGTPSSCIIDRATESEKHAASCRIDHWLRGFDHIVHSSLAKKNVLNISIYAIDPEVMVQVQDPPLAGVELSAVNLKTMLHRSLKQLESLPQGVNTRLLMALHEGKDISKCLEEREEYHKSQKEKMKKKLCQKKIKKTCRKSRTTSVHHVSSGVSLKFSASTSAVNPITHSSDEKSALELPLVETSGRRIKTRKKRISLVPPDPAFTETSDAESLESSGSLFDISEFCDVNSDSSEDEVCQEESVNKLSLSKLSLDKTSQPSMSLPSDRKQLSRKITSTPCKRKATKGLSEKKQKKPHMELNSSFKEESGVLDLSILGDTYKEICSSPNPVGGQSEEGTPSPKKPLQSQLENENVITKPSALSPHQPEEASHHSTSDCSSDIPLAQGGSALAQSIPQPSQLSFEASLFGPTQETLLTQSSEVSIVPFNILRARSSRELRLDTTEICKILFKDSPPRAFEPKKSEEIQATTLQSSPPRAVLSNELALPAESNLNLNTTHVSGATQDTLFSFSDELSDLFKQIHLSHPDEKLESSREKSHMSDSNREIHFSSNKHSSPLFTNSPPFHVQCGSLLSRKKLEFDDPVSSSRKNSVSEKYQLPNSTHSGTKIENTSVGLSDVSSDKGAELTSKGQFQKIIDWLQDNTNESDMPNNLLGQMNTPSVLPSKSCGPGDRQSPSPCGSQKTSSKRCRGSQSDSDTDSGDSICSSLPASVTRMSLLSPGMKYLVDPNLAGFLSSPNSLRQKKITSRRNNSMTAK